VKIYTVFNLWYHTSMLTDDNLY